MNHFNVRQNIIVPNVSWGMDGLHECDLLILRKSNLATEVEIKISKADLLKDKDKSHAHDHKLISKLYFAVPEYLEEIALQSIPLNAGLLIVKLSEYEYHSVIYKRYLVEEVKPCVIRKNAVKWNDKQRYNLARLGTMRILGLKRKVDKLQKQLLKQNQNE